MKNESVDWQRIVENFLGSLSIRTDVKDLSVTKTDDEQICFGFLCYFTSIK